ncbi:unnamed protein product [Paramecium octaurelia]|uniref:Uncharacterized protein n=1 Tax=Paramecium octaurelia TaxID=43137 RepID=A0A8S1USQ6_PAROT|nr:unnamed protein product [Paramecium octaurelia]
MANKFKYIFQQNYNRVIKRIDDTDAIYFWLICDILKLKYPNPLKYFYSFDDTLILIIRIIIQHMRFN